VTFYGRAPYWAPSPTAQQPWPTYPKLETPWSWVAPKSYAAHVYVHPRIFYTSTLLWELASRIMLDTRIY